MHRPLPLMATALAVVALVATAAACGGSGDPVDSVGSTDSGGSAASDARPDDEAAASGVLDAAGLADLAGSIAQARSATARYAFDRQQAESDGYTAITPMMPNMGYHLMNPDITDFDPARPPILVYLPTPDGWPESAGWQLGALEWVFPERPDEPPFPGAEYGEFGAACHYTDGTFVFADDESACGASNPDTAAAFSFWHPDLVTMHLWVWYPNPDGLFAGTNPLVGPFNEPAPTAATSSCWRPC